ncbi:hypothetical protein D3C83_265370 [compost metagenome]
MLKHVQERDHVIAIGRKHRQVGQCRFDHRTTQPLAGEFPRDRVELARLNPAEARQHAEIVAGTGT